METPTKEIFDNASAIYSELGRVARVGVCPHSRNPWLYREFNDLMKQYDFNNRLLTGADGRQGVEWCWGGVMVPPVYDAVTAFTPMSLPAKGCFTIVKSGDVDLLLDWKGREVMRADELRPSEATVTPVIFRRGDRWGIASAKGEKVLAPAYDSIECAGNGFYFISLGGKWGLLDPFGHTVEPKFDSIEFDADDNIAVTLDARQGFIDAEGNFTEDADDAFYAFESFL